MPCFSEWCGMGHKVYIEQNEWWKADNWKSLNEAMEFLESHGVNMNDLHMEVDNIGLFLIIEDPTLAMLFKLMKS
ncbi:hypothetical protein D3C87_637430 [compost metagenome]